MATDEKQTIWKVLSRFVEIKSPWLTVIGERLLDDNNSELEYWRVEKADSLVIITVQGDMLLLPKPMYRPGVGRVTLDFCGGRMDPSKELAENAGALLQKEFGLSDTANLSCTPINADPWDVNSSFENQQLYGAVVELPASARIDRANLGGEYKLTPEGINGLLSDLRCLQCRALLLDWLRTSEYGRNVH